MKSPLHSGDWVDLFEVDSTQRAAERILKGDVPGATAGVLLAKHQTTGVGRFDRVWHSEPDASLTLSLVFREYADHPKPWLIGMGVACACASALHCRLWWPNDLVYEGKKLGGVLTQVFTDASSRRVPVVGIGVNLAVQKFPPEFAGNAINLRDFVHGPLDPKAIARTIIDRIETLPEPDSWESLRSVWMLFDSTPGKRYELASGEQAVGIGIGPEGELICAVEGETTTVFAADALFGTRSPVLPQG